MSENLAEVIKRIEKFADQRDWELNPSNAQDIRACALLLREAALAQSLNPSHPPSSGSSGVATASDNRVWADLEYEIEQLNDPDGRPGFDACRERVLELFAAIEDCPDYDTPSPTAAVAKDAAHVEGRRTLAEKAADPAMSEFERTYPWGAIPCTTGTLTEEDTKKALDAQRMTISPVAQMPQATVPAISTLAKQVSELYSVADKMSEYIEQIEKLNALAAPAQAGSVEQNGEDDV